MRLPMRSLFALTILSAVFPTLAGLTGCNEAAKVDTATSDKALPEAAEPPGEAAATGTDPTGAVVPDFIHPVRIADSDQSALAVVFVLRVIVVGVDELYGPEVSRSVEHEAGHMLVALDGAVDQSAFKDVAELPSRVG